MTVVLSYPIIISIVSCSYIIDTVDLAVGIRVRFKFNTILVKPYVGFHDHDRKAYFKSITVFSLKYVFLFHKKIVKTKVPYLFYQHIVI